MKTFAAVSAALGVAVLLFAAWSSGTREPRKTAAGQAQIEAFKAALGAYKLDNGDFPSTSQGLAALRVRPANAPHWSGPYIAEDANRDPWNHEWIYKYPGDHGKGPDIASYGADGTPGGDGINADIVSWPNH